MVQVSALDIEADMYVMSLNKLNDDQAWINCIKGLVNTDLNKALDDLHLISLTNYMNPKDPDKESVQVLPKSVDITYHCNLFIYYKGEGHYDVQFTICWHLR